MHMPIDDIRAKQRADQTQAIKTRLEAGSIVRIGNHLPITGRYEVLESDGGISNNGVKVYNAQEQYGDRVLAYPRLDGTIALDSEKGSIVRPPTAFPVCPGYLKGQVFNCEEPKKKKKGKVWVLFSLNGKMFVGGHQDVPEMIYDSVAPNNPLDISPGNLNLLQIWGDSVGWEASFSIGGTTAVFVTQQDEIIQRTIKTKARGGAIIDYNFALSGAQRLGKGLWLNRYDVVQSPGFEIGSYPYTWAETWRNMIFDAAGVSVGSGEGKRIASDVDADLAGTLSWVESAAFPLPNSVKTANFTEFQTFTSRPTYTQTTVRSNVDSYCLMFRDRSSSLFHRTNFYNISMTGGGPITPDRVTDFLVSDGKTDITLFSVGDIQPRTHDNNRPFALFGEIPQNFEPRSTDSYKFNNPSVTQVQGRSQLVTHLNSEKSYDVKVFDIFSKASLIDGVHTIEKIDVWGIPVGAVIYDVAAWVP